VAMGRPRAFDMDQALDQALRVFWEKGYDGASVADLTEAIGINPPSLYAAFGNKEALFKKALDRYEAKRDQIMEEAFAAPTAREAVTRLLEGTAERLSDKCNPRGCPLARFVATVMHGMAVQAAGGAAPKELRAIVNTALRAWPA
jgi:AcrR family transcriptional regulator